MHLNYRKDIDGLRALAVLCVVYFHAFPEKLSGGFIGVDIFFVISGFLITKIIATEIDEEKFSLKNFYSRRVRRIFPALFVVLVASGLFGWFFLLYEEYKQLGKHLFAGASFISNLVLWSESSYFDNVADTKPLLHLWSLGIEEQFYIFWPIFLWGASKLRVNLILFTALLIITSFLYNIYLIQIDAVATFYSPATRSWELLIGSLLALCQKQYDINQRFKAINLAHVGSVVGLFFITCPLFFLTKYSNFPGWLAVIPVSGAVILLLTPSISVVNQYFLSNRLIVAIGLISYPLYLWHWPILSFLRISAGREPAVNLRYKAVIASFILAYITYRYVETPVRYGLKRYERVKILIMSGLIIFVGMIGYLIYLNEGRFIGNNEPLLNIYDGDIGHAEFNHYLFENFYACTPSSIHKQAPVWEGYHRCLQSHEDKALDIALVGNSHAEHLFIGLAENFPKKI